MIVMPINKLIGITIIAVLWNRQLISILKFIKEEQEKTNYTTITSENRVATLKVDTEE